MEGPIRGQEPFLSENKEGLVIRSGKQKKIPLLQQSKDSTIFIIYMYTHFNYLINIFFNL